MAITIGPFTNVPNPGEPIRSPWAQQVTRYVVNLPYVYVATPTAVSVAPSVATTITLSGAASTTDPYTVVTAGGLVIPTGYGGLWHVTASFSIGSHGNAKPAAVWIGLGATRYGQSQVVCNPTDGQSTSAAGIINAAAGTTIVFGGFNFNTSALSIGVQYLTAVFLGGTGGAPQ